MPTELSAKDKVVLVTGAGRGIGAAIARRLAADRARVIAAARTTKQLDALMAELKPLRGDCLAVPTDLASEASIDNLVRVVNDEVGRLDALVNNAGVAWAKPIGEVTLEDWRALMAVNVDAVFLLTSKLLPVFHAQHNGQIVNICSDAGIRGIGGMTCYCASKFALRGFTLALREELRGSGIRTNLVLPGPVNTTIIAKEADRMDLPQPEDIADVVWQVIALPSRADVWEVLVEPGPV